MLESGYIRLHRSLKKWKWFEDVNVLSVWIYLLLSANYEPRMFRDRLVERGQLVTSLRSLQEGTGLSVQKIRTALKKLQNTGEIRYQSNRHYSLITIVKYGDYQSDGAPGAKACADGARQTESKPETDGQLCGNGAVTTMEALKKIKKGKKERPLSPPYDDFGFSAEMRERLDQWLRYKQERGERYRPTGLQGMLQMVAQETERLGERAVLCQITSAIASGWRGMHLDKCVPSGRRQEGAGGFAEVAGDW